MAYIKAQNVSVSFPLLYSVHRSLKSAVLHATTGGRIAKDTHQHVVVRALENVSFEIKPGDRVGLIGHNGAGKSTLLRVVSGIYEPQQGKLDVQGKVATLLDLSLGVDPEATGYENIMYRGILLGLTRKEIRAKANEIAEFTDLGDYLNMPVRTYSSGMQLRLAFAVSTSVEADILLMDEWLSVGDRTFAEKAAKRLQDLVARTPILMLASHSMALIKQVCNRAFLLERGVVTEVPVSSLPDDRNRDPVLDLATQTD